MSDIDRKTRVIEDNKDEETQFTAGRRAPYTQVADWVMLNDSLSRNAKLLYVYLAMRVNVARRDGMAWPSRRALADHMGYTKTESVDPLIRELVAMGAIEVLRRKLPGTLVNANNLYTVHETPPDGYMGVTSVSGDGRRAVSEAKTDTPEVAQSKGPRVAPVKGVAPHSGPRVAPHSGPRVAPHSGHELKEVELKEVNKNSSSWVKERNYGKGDVRFSSEPEAAPAASEAEGSGLPGRPRGASGDETSKKKNFLNSSREDQEPSAPEPAARPRAPRADFGAETVAPEDLELTEETRRWLARMAPGLDVEGEIRRMLEHNRKSGRMSVDWEAKFKGWVRRKLAMGLGGVTAEEVARERAARFCQW